MAKSSNKSAVLVLLLCLVLLSNVEGKLLGIGFEKSIPVCETVYGAKAGDTCSGIVQKFKLDATVFSDINPNLNCNAIFVGQWLCIAAILN